MNENITSTLMIIAFLLLIAIFVRDLLNIKDDQYINGYNFKIGEECFFALNKDVAQEFNPTYLKTQSIRLK